MCWCQDVDWQNDWRNFQLVYFFPEAGFENHVTLLISEIVAKGADGCLTAITRLVSFGFLGTYSRISS